MPCRRLPLIHGGTHTHMRSRAVKRTINVTSTKACMHAHTHAHSFPVCLSLNMRISFIFATHAHASLLQPVPLSLQQTRWARMIKVHIRPNNCRNALLLLLLRYGCQLRPPALLCSSKVPDISHAFRGPQHQSLHFQ